MLVGALVVVVDHNPLHPLACVCACVCVCVCPPLHQAAQSLKGLVGRSYFNLIDPKTKVSHADTHTPTRASRAHAPRLPPTEAFG
jgi:hypothetical protein